MSADKPRIHRAEHGTVTALYWAQDASRLAVVDAENSITIYNTADPTQPPARLHVHADRQLGNLAFHPVQRQIAVSDYQRIKVFNTQNGDLQHEIAMQDYVSYSVAYSPDARYVGVTMWHHASDPYGNGDGKSGAFGLWDMQQAKWVLRQITAYPATFVCFDAPTSRLAWTTTQGIVYLWDMATMSEIGRFHQPTQTLMFALPTFLGEAILIEQSDDYTTQQWIWHPAADRVEKLPSLQALATFVTLPDEPLYFVIQDDRVSHDYSAAETESESDIPLPPGWTFRYQFHHRTHIWDSHRNRIVYTLPDFRSGSAPLAIHMLTQQLAYSVENVVYVVDLKRQAMSATFAP